MRRAPVLLVCAFTSACGAVTALLDGVPDEPDGSVADASPDRDASPERDAGADRAADAGNDAATDVQDARDDTVYCSADASKEAGPCVVPPDDLFYASPSSMTVSAGTYGVATFVVGGSWADASDFYALYDTASIPLRLNPYVMTNRPPVAFAFLTTPGSAGQSGSITVSGHAGDIVVHAQVQVTITSCQPSQAQSCGDYVCGFVPGNCGGSFNCGACATDEYCYLGQCVSNAPTYCPSGQGLGPGGSCQSCDSFKVCAQCPAGLCLGIQDVCVCAEPPFPACPTSQPDTTVQCPSVGQVCTYAGPGCGEACQCDPSGLWGCGPASCDGGTE
jgi:hypothetical protein